MTAPTPRRPLHRRRWHPLHALVAGVLLLVAGVAALVWWQMERAYREARAQTLSLAEVRGMQLAQAKGGQIASLLASVDLALRQIRREWVVDGDPVSLDSRVRSLLDAVPMEAVSHFTLVDAQGWTVYTSLPGASRVNLTDRDYFRTHQQGGDRLLIGKPLQSRLSGQWSTLVTRPILRDGRFDGVVIASVPNERLAQLLGQLSLEQNDIVALTHADGAFLARTRDNAQAMGREVPRDRPFLSPDSGERGVFYQPGLLDQVDRLYTWHRIRPYGLVLVVGADQTRMLAPLIEANQRNRQTAVGLVALTALAGGIIILLLVQTARRQAALEDSEAFRRRVFDSSPVPVVVVDLRHGRFIDCNPAAVQAYGFASREEVLACTHTDVSAPVQYDGTPSDEAAQRELQRVLAAGSTVFDWRLRRRDGTLWDAEVHLQVFESGGRRLCQFTLRDITDRKLAEERIQELVDHDELTRLLNRRGFLGHLSRVHAQADRRGGVYALLFIDLDHFKHLNDSLGHDAGDAALRQIAQRLVAHTRRADVVARLGGDEFVVVLAADSEAEAVEAAGRLAAKLLDALRVPLDLNGRPFTLSCSLGIALGDPRRASSGDVLRGADLAMYSVKESGRNSFRFFDEQIQHRMLARIGLEQDLRVTLAAQPQTALALHLQPIVDAGLAVLGYEALLRWDRPGQGRVSPADFIPVAEQSGLIVPLGEWVLREACRMLSDWARRPGLADSFLAVNVSALQLQQPAFVAGVADLLRETGAPPHRLKLELTESLLHKDIDETVAKLHELRKLGVRLSLDDFGTGYSSLSLLRRLPIQELKIDRSFVLHALDQADDAAVARMIVQLAQTLGMDVVAEGVETAEQLDFLLGIGCRQFQGYKFGRPEPVADALAHRAR